MYSHHDGTGEAMDCAEEEHFEANHLHEFTKDPASQRH